MTMAPKHVCPLSCHAGRNVRWPQTLAVPQEQQQLQHWCLPSLRHAAPCSCLRAELSHARSPMRPTDHSLHLPKTSVHPSARPAAASETRLTRTGRAAVTQTAVTLTDIPDLSKLLLQQLCSFHAAGAAATVPPRLHVCACSTASQHSSCLVGCF